MYKRVLLKISGEACSSKTATFDSEFLNELALELKKVINNGTQVAIVVGGGNIMRGKFASQLGLSRMEVVIYGGGTGNPYFSTDSAAALRACEISAQAILMAKNGVDGVYDSDPDKNKNAKKYDTITYMEMIEKQLQVMDLTAVSMCKENNIHTVVFNGNQLSNISKVLADETIGTVIK